ncbi:MAG: CRISPR-associated protein Cas4 [Candidatus Jordarchaeum sp.]|uniref:CRISPR-associated protein Cas4 n=1 Tax=Candidatus Jordarchaeum sp. TaxID=2823881 RepID=UPI00404AE1F4
MTVWETKPRIVFTAEDLRQYGYCKRKLYFRYVLKARFSPTVKMVRGEQVHEKTCRAKRVEIEEERGVSRYYNMYLCSEALGLAAMIDYFEYDGEKITLVDVKSGAGSSKAIYTGYYLQMAAYALLLEVCLEIPVKSVVIRYEDDKKERILEIDFKAKVTVIQILKKLREMVENEVMPPPTANPKKCTDCEAWKICRRC